MMAPARARLCVRRALFRCKAATSAESGLGSAVLGPRLPGTSALNAPASRCRRHSLRLDEQSPSRWRIAPIPRVSAARSISARMRGLSLAVNVRRRGRSDKSGDAEAGAATIVGLRPPFIAAPASASVGVWSMGMGEMILGHPQG